MGMGNGALEFRLSAISLHLVISRHMTDLVTGTAQIAASSTDSAALLTLHSPDLYLFIESDEIVIRSVKLCLFMIPLEYSRYPFY